MADKVVSMQQNSDGSFDFGFLFDNGAGITGSVGTTDTYSYVCWAGN